MKGRQAVGAADQIPEQDPDPESAPDRDSRSGRLFAATLLTAHRPPQPITIRNVSPRGIGARAEKLPKIGEQVKILLGQFGEVTGEVRWIHSQYFGVRLDEVLDTDHLTFDRTASARASAEHEQIAERFKPASSTWRPGFRTR